MRVESVHVIYVDSSGKPHLALAGVSRVESEATTGYRNGDFRGKELLTLAYFDAEKRQELMRCNLGEALVVRHDVPHASHPSRRRHEHDGFLVKPGDYFVWPGEKLPRRSVRYTRDRR